MIDIETLRAASADGKARREAAVRKMTEELLPEWEKVMVEAADGGEYRCTLNLGGPKGEEEATILLEEVRRIFPFFTVDNLHPSSERLDFGIIRTWKCSISWNN